MIRTKSQCIICGNEYTQLSNHLNYSHNITKEHYYLKYILKTDTIPKCVCGKDLIMNSLQKGYSKYCSSKCSTTYRNVPNPFSDKKIINKIKQTKLDKYNNCNYNNYNKAKLTNLEKYGVEHYNLSNLVKSQKKLKYFNTFKRLISERNIVPLFDQYVFSELNDNYNFHCNSCNNDFTISNENGTGSFSAWRIVCPCKKTSQTSNMENELKLKIQEFYDGKVELNKYFNINNKRYELDIYIEEFNLGIELNGIYWHSEKFKDSDYHINKTNWFKDNFDISVIHVREDEWHLKQNIVLSIIKNKMNLSKKIYGRKTIKKEIDSKTYKKFLNENHIQGAMNSKTKLGLFYEDELVQVIGIGHSRFEKHTIELHRMCTKLNHQVIGGFSKLLKGFDNITTYCNLSYFNGNGYETIGFKELNITKPGFNITNFNIVESRQKYQKHKISSILEIYNSNLTAHENLILNGFYRIYDCGNIKLKLNREN